MRNHAPDVTGRTMGMRVHMKMVIYSTLGIEEEVVLRDLFKNNLFLHYTVNSLYYSLISSETRHHCKSLYDSCLLESLPSIIS